MIEATILIEIHKLLIELILLKIHYLLHNPTSYIA